MTQVLDDLQLEYRGMLRHGVIPTGIVISESDFRLIRVSASRGDRRLQWDGGDEIELVFGFTPLVAKDEHTHFISRLHPQPAAHRSRAYTLEDLRSL